MYIHTYIYIHVCVYICIYVCVYTFRGRGLSYLLLSTLFLSGGGSDNRLIAVVASESGSLRYRHRYRYRYMCVCIHQEGGGSLTCCSRPCF